MSAEEWGDSGWVACSCCGKLVRDTAEDNADFSTRGHDRGFGMCRECGGEEPDTWEAASQMTEAEFKQKQGWALANFFNARMDTMRQGLKPENQAKWDAMPYWQKCMFIERAVQDGLIS